MRLEGGGGGGGGRGHVSDSILGGHNILFLTNSLKFLKYWEARVPPPPPPAPRSMVMRRTDACEKHSRKRPNNKTAVSSECNGRNGSLNMD